MKEWLGVSHIVMKIALGVTGDKTLMVIGYKYISNNVLGFIYTEGSGIN